MVENQQKIGIKLDQEIILLGLAETLRGNDKLTVAEVTATLSNYELKMKAASESKAKQDAERLTIVAVRFLQENTQ